jgi:hypothetical protein
MRTRPKLHILQHEQGLCQQDLSGNCPPTSFYSTNNRTTRPTSEIQKWYATLFPVPRYRSLYVLISFSLLGDNTVLSQLICLAPLRTASLSNFAMRENRNGATGLKMKSCRCPHKITGLPRVQPLRSLYVLYVLASCCIKQKPHRHPRNNFPVLGSTTVTVYKCVLSITSRCDESYWQQARRDGTKSGRPLTQVRTYIHNRTAYKRLTQFHTVSCPVVVGWAT